MVTLGLQKSGRSKGGRYSQVVPRKMLKLFFGFFFQFPL
jgi:hypothetical protein